MTKKIIIIILILIEIWSATGVIVTINNKEKIKENQNEIKEELNTEKDNQTDDNTLEENETENNKEEDTFNKIDEVIIDNNSTSSENDKTNNNTSNTTNNNSNIESTDKTQNNEIKEEIKEDTTINTPSEPVTLVSTTTKTEDAITTKYGVKITVTKTYTVNTYSDGKVEKIEINSSNPTYDKSGYNATTNDLKNEATGLAIQNKSIYNEILGYVNGYRNAVGRSNLVLDDTLSIAATIRAMELAYTSDVMSISHTRPNGSRFWSIFSDMGIGYRATGENIAADSGYGTPQSVTNSWKNSQGHYENMINEKYGKIGVGYVELGGNKYWVQLFTN